MQRKLKIAESALVLIIIITLIMVGKFFFDGKYTLNDLNPNPYFCLLLIVCSNLDFIRALYFSLGMFILFLILIYFQTDLAAMDENIFNFEVLILPLSFLALGPFLGELRGKAMRRIFQQQEDMKTQSTLVDSYRETVDYMEKVNTELKTRLVGQLTTLQTLYESAKKFVTYDEDELFSAVINLLVTHIEMEGAALYIKDKEGLFRLRREYLKEKRGLVKVWGETLSAEDITIQQCLNQFKMATLQDEVRKIEDLKQNGNTCVLAAPLMVRNKIVGVFAIYHMPFLSYISTNHKFFSLTIEWMSRAYGQILDYKQVKDSVVFDMEIEAYNESYFLERLEEEFLRAKTYMLPLTVAKIAVPQADHWSVSKKRAILRLISLICQKNFRKIDCVCLTHKEQFLHCLLPVIAPEECQLILNSIRRDIDALNLENDQTGEKIETIISHRDFNPQMTTYLDLLNPESLR